MELTARIKQVKNKINCFDVITKIGLKITPQRKINCLWHLEKTPSLRVYENHFYCFGCGKTADAIDFIKQEKGINMQAALVMLEEFSGSFIPTVKESLPVHHVSFFECMQDERFKARVECIRFISSYLNFRTQEKIKQGKVPKHIGSWLKSRGYELETLLTQYSNDNIMYVENVREMTEELKLNVQNWKISNLFNPDGRLKWFGYEYGVAFPISNRDGITSMRLRNVLGGQVKDVELPSIYGMPSGFGWMGYDWAVKHESMTDKELTVYLTEGAPDMLAGMQLFGKSGHVVLSTGNVKKSSLIHNLELFRNCGNLVLCFDNDAVGEKTTIQVARMAKIMGFHKVSKFNLLENKDLNDYLKAAKI